MTRIRSQVATWMADDLTLHAMCPCGAELVVPAPPTPGGYWDWYPGAEKRGCEHYLGLAAGPREMRTVACFSVPERPEVPPWG